MANNDIEANNTGAKCQTLLPCADIFLLFDEIDNNSTKSACEWILNANFSPESERPSILNLVINSPGGSVTDAFALIDIMGSSVIPIRTVGLGQVRSAGLMIFLAGAKDERILTPNTSIMSHMYSWESSGKHHELIAINREFELTHKRIMEHYKKTTKLKEVNIKKYLLPTQDVYLSAEEALKLKICDKISYLR